jgi:hypothetical protein
VKRHVENKSAVTFNQEGQAYPSNWDCINDYLRALSSKWQSSIRRLSKFQYKLDMKGFLKKHCSIIWLPTTIYCTPKSTTKEALPVDQILNQLLGFRDIGTMS